MNQATTSQAQALTFNLIVEGVGYLNRVRQVEVKKGPAYLACTVNALMGDSNQVEYLSIDCIVVGKLAKQTVSQLTAASNSKQKVLIGFRAGDPKPEFYEFEDRDTKQMVQRSGLKARLLQITFAKVDGVKVDIPLVQRASDSDAPAGTGDDSGVGSACGDESRALVAA
jgi:hypothetical protein